LKEAKKRQNKYADQNSKDESFQIGDPVYLRNHSRTSKLDNKWTSYYRIIEQNGPVSFRVKNQLTGTTTKAQARHLRMANLEEWTIPKEKIGRPLRKSTYVVPPDEADDESYDADDSEDELPLKKIITEREKNVQTQKVKRIFR